MVKISDLVALKQIIKDTKIGKMSNEGLRSYLKLSLQMNKYATEFEEKRKTLITETVENKGFDLEKLTGDQDREVFEVIAPILEEHLNTEVDIETKVLSWDDLCTGVLNVDANSSISFDIKTRITELLCKDDI